MKRVRGVSAARRFDRQECLSESVEILHQIFQAVDIFSRQTLREFGVTGPQIWALRTIGEAGVASMGELAHHIHLHMSTVTGIIDRLETAKLVSRERSRKDARVAELRLTSKGRSILTRAPEPPRSKAARGLQKLTSRELKHLRSGLLLLAQAMDVRLSPPAAAE